MFHCSNPKGHLLRLAARIPLPSLPQPIRGGFGEGFGGSGEDASSHCHG